MLRRDSPVCAQRSLRNSTSTGRASAAPSTRPAMRSTSSVNHWKPERIAVARLGRIGRRRTAPPAACPASARPARSDPRHPNRSRAAAPPAAAVPVRDCGGSIGPESLVTAQSLPCRGPPRNSARTAAPPPRDAASRPRRLRSSSLTTGRAVKPERVPHRLLQARSPDGKNVGMAGAEHQVDLRRPRPDALDARVEQRDRLLGRQPLEHARNRARRAAIASAMTRTVRYLPPEKPVARTAVFARAPDSSPDRARPRSSSKRAPDRAGAGDRQLLAADDLGEPDKARLGLARHRTAPARFAHRPQPRIELDQRLEMPASASAQSSLSVIMLEEAHARRRRAISADFPLRAKPQWLAASRPRLFGAVHRATAANARRAHSCCASKTSTSTRCKPEFDARDLRGPALARPRVAGAGVAPVRALRGLRRGRAKRLQRSGLLYPCFCSRTEIAAHADRHRSGWRAALPRHLPASRPRRESKTGLRRANRCSGGSTRRRGDGAAPAR